MIWFIYHSSQFVPIRPWPGWCFSERLPTMINLARQVCDEEGRPVVESLFQLSYQPARQSRAKPQSWPLSCHHLVLRQLEQSGAVWRGNQSWLWSESLMTVLCLVSGFYFSLYKIYIIKTLLSISRWQFRLTGCYLLWWCGGQLRVFIP